MLQRNDPEAAEEAKKKTYKIRVRNYGELNKSGKFYSYKIIKFKRRSAGSKKMVTKRVPITSWITVEVKKPVFA